MEALCWLCTWLGPGPGLGLVLWLWLRPRRPGWACSWAAWRMGNSSGAVPERRVDGAQPECVSAARRLGAARVSLSVNVTRAQFRCPRPAARRERTGVHPTVLAWVRPPAPPAPLARAARLTLRHASPPSALVPCLPAPHAPRRARAPTWLTPRRARRRQGRVDLGPRALQGRHPGPDAAQDAVGPRRAGLHAERPASRPPHARPRRRARGGPARAFRRRRRLLQRAPMCAAMPAPGRTSVRPQRRARPPARMAPPLSPPPPPTHP